MYVGIFWNGLDARSCESALNPVVMEIMSSVNKYFSLEILAPWKSEVRSEWLKAAVDVSVDEDEAVGGPSCSA